MTVLFNTLTDCHIQISRNPDLSLKERGNENATLIDKQYANRSCHHAIKSLMRVNFRASSMKRYLLQMCYFEERMLHLRIDSLVHIA